MYDPDIRCVGDVVISRKLTRRERSMIMRDFGGNPAIKMQVHDKCCGPCPSKNGHDLETLDYMKLPLKLRMMTIFPCAWRPEKVCRGIYNLMAEVSVEV